MNTILSERPLTRRELLLQKIRDNDISLNEIFLSGEVPLKEEEVEIIADYLKKTSNIITVAIYGRILSQKGFVTLLNAMGINSSVSKIVLSRHRNFCSICGKNSITALAEFIKHNSNVTDISLDLPSNKRFSEITEALKVNSSITKIRFNNSYLEDKGAIELADTLKINSSITKVELPFNGIKNEGSKALAEILKVNSNITDIDLSINQIGNDGLKALADAIKINYSVTNIDLYTNRFGTIGVIALAEALKINSTIQTIDLSYNQVRVEGALALAEAFKINSSIKTIKLTNSHIDKIGLDALKNSLEFKHREIITRKGCKPLAFKKPKIKTQDVTEPPKKRTKTIQ